MCGVGVCVCGGVLVGVCGGWVCGCGCVGVGVCVATAFVIISPHRVIFSICDSDFLFVFTAFFEVGKMISYTLIISYVTRPVKMSDKTHNLNCSYYHRLNLCDVLNCLLYQIKTPLRLYCLKSLILIGSAMFGVTFNLVASVGIP